MQGCKTACAFLLYDFFDDPDLIAFVQVPVGLYDLLYGVTDQVCDDHKVCSIVQEHRDEGVSEVVIADSFYISCGDILVERARQHLFADRFLSAEEEGRLSLIVRKSRAQSGADRGIADLFVF